MLLIENYENGNKFTVEPMSVNIQSHYDYKIARVGMIGIYTIIAEFDNMKITLYRELCDSKDAKIFKYKHMILINRINEAILDVEKEDKEHKAEPVNLNLLTKKLAEVIDDQLLKFIFDSMITNKSE